jgi:hypothetical protein
MPGMVVVTFQLSQLSLENHQLGCLLGCVEQDQRLPLGNDIPSFNEYFLYFSGYRVKKLGFADWIYLGGVGVAGSLL